MIGFACMRKGVDAYERKIVIFACIFVLVLASIPLPKRSRAKVVIQSFQELREVLGDERYRQVELGADISVTGPVTIRGNKTVNGRGHMLERRNGKGKKYAGTLFLMIGTRCEWKNVVISGAGKGGDVTTFGRLLEARSGKTVLGPRSVWKDNINRRLAVDGGGALWIRSGAACHIEGGEISHNENVSRGAGVRVERGAQLFIGKGKITDNTVRGIDAAEGFEGLGAAIYNEGKTVMKGGVLERNRAIAYIDNEASYGGAGGAVYNRGNCLITGGTIQGNHASQRGGALYLDRNASLRIGGGSFLSNRDSENRCIWLGGNCTLYRSAKIPKLYIDSSASVKVGKDWGTKQKTEVEPFSYVPGRCLMHGAEGRFVLKEKRGFALIFKKGGHYIEKQAVHKKKAAEPVESDNPLPVRAEILCRRDALVFYEGEYVTGEVLKYGISARDAAGRELPVSLSGKAYREGILDTGHPGKGSITIRAGDSRDPAAAKTVTYEIRENKAPQVTASRAVFYSDEIAQMGSGELESLLKGKIHGEDDHEKARQLEMETRVECSDLLKKQAGEYRVPGYVRDQLGHRYYMGEGEEKRYGEGKRTAFFIDVTIVERKTASQERRTPLVRFTPILPSAPVIEEWHFDWETIRDIQKFMDGRKDPFSGETNREFMRRYQKYSTKGRQSR